MKKNIFVVFSTLSYLKTTILPLLWIFSIYLAMKESLNLGLFIASIAAGGVVFLSELILNADGVSIIMKNPFLAAAICTAVLVITTAIMQVDHFSKWAALATAASTVWTIAASISYFKQAKKN